MNRIFLWRIPYSEHNGLVSRASPGTHETALEILLANNISKDNILDLAAGTGSFVSRLDSSGFTSISAVELDLKSFQFKKITPISLDLNSNFSDEIKKQFNTITATEIIEHLDDPRHFLNQIHLLLKENGYLLVSTPNVQHWVSRLKFLFRGELRFFAAQDYLDQRHITPIFDSHFRLMFKEVGFQLIEFRTGASGWGVIKKALSSCISLFFRVFGGKITQGDISFYLLKKTSPDKTFSGSTSRYTK